METETSLFRHFKFGYDMDKDRVKKLCETVLDISFSGTTLKDFEMLPTFQYDNVLEKWVPDSYSLFIHISSPNLREKSYGPVQIKKTLEGLLGFECCVDFT
jgi:hypothetical protein